MEKKKITNIVTWQKIVARKSFNKEKLKQINSFFANLDDRSCEEILIECKYYFYIQMQLDEVKKMKEMLNVKIPSDLDFKKISGLSNEVVEKLNKFNPPTLFAASEISGITPAAIDLLHIYIKMQSRKNNSHKDI